MYYCYFSIIIDIYICHVFFMIISGNILNHLSAIQPLNGSNYDSWRETIKIALARMEIDLALTTDALKEPEKHVLCDGETTQAFATRERDFAPIRMAYDLERGSGMRPTISVSWSVRAPSRGHKSRNPGL
jgi:hypothetical protein